MTHQTVPNAGEQPGSAEAMRPIRRRPQTRSDFASTNLWSDQALERLQSSAGDRSLVGDRYEILGPLGTGGMAEIYRVRHTMLNKVLALKVVRPGLSVGGREHTMFVREARLASRLDHPNIVQVTDFGVDDQRGAYLVMELLDGRTLYEELNRHGPLDDEAAIALALQVAHALRYMHNNEVIHGDIKAENVLLVSDPQQPHRHYRTKLIDFGLSKPWIQGVRLSELEIGGSPHYMAPEIIARGAPQPTSDVYAFGVLLFEMITGDPPFDGEVKEIVAAHRHQAPTLPSGPAGRPIAPRLESLIMSCLAKSPAERPQGFDEIVASLEVMGPRGSGAEPDASQLNPAAAGIQADSGALAHAMFQDSPVPMFHVDWSGRLLLANPVLGLLLGIDIAPMLGRPFGETPLATCAPDMMEAIEHHLGQGLREVTQQPMRCQGASSSMTLTCCLVPHVDGAGAYQGVHAYLLPSAPGGSKS